MLLSDKAKKVFVFKETFPESAAKEHAEKKKMDAFGTLTKLKFWDKPKEEEIINTGVEKRFEPFWFVKARRRVEFRRSTKYSVPITNLDAKIINVNGEEYQPRDFPLRVITIDAVETCAKEIAHESFLDGMKDARKTRDHQEYLKRYRPEEVEKPEGEEFLKPEVRGAYLIQEVTSKIAKAVDADEIIADESEIESMHLYYRPVFAFEYTWSSKGKIGIVEVDGLSGEVFGNGQSFKKYMGKISDREVLFDIGAEALNTFVPGGGLAVKIISVATK
ncbi:hypothetical protein [Thermithiobacillus plumbiphilus]|uniref:Uncharacterized protein n=1 Tax=Thermithiobacillus plumbiphilus TaxID=1729899 RepID=A0ABU9DA75_9PROT